MPTVKHSGAPPTEDRQTWWSYASVHMFELHKCLRLIHLACEIVAYACLHHGCDNRLTGHDVHLSVHVSSLGHRMQYLYDIYVFASDAHFSCSIVLHGSYFYFFCIFIRFQTQNFDCIRKFCTSEWLAVNRNLSKEIMRPWTFQNVGRGGGNKRWGASGRPANHLRGQ